jgi:hypothetical protein
VRGTVGRTSTGGGGATVGVTPAGDVGVVGGAVGDTVGGVVGGEVGATVELVVVGATVVATVVVVDVVEVVVASSIGSTSAGDDWTASTTAIATTRPSSAHSAKTITLTTTDPVRRAAVAVGSWDGGGSGVVELTVFALSSDHRSGR